MKLKENERDLIAYLLRVDVQRISNICGFQYTKIKDTIDQVILFLHALTHLSLCYAQYQVGKIKSEEEKQVCVNKEIQGYFRQDIQRVQNMEDVNSIHLLKYILCNLIILLANWKNIQIGRIEQMQDQLNQIKRLAANYEDVLDKLDYLFSLVRLYNFRQEIHKTLSSIATSSSQSQQTQAKETHKNNLGLLKKINDEQTDIQYQQLQQKRIQEIISIEMHEIELILKSRKRDELVENGIKLVYFNISSIGYILSKKQSCGKKFYFADKSIEAGLQIESLLKRYFLVEEMNLVLYMMIQYAKQTMNKALITKALQFKQQNQEVLTLQNIKLEKISKKLDKLNKIVNFFHKEIEDPTENKLSKESEENKLKLLKNNKELFKLKQFQKGKTDTQISNQNNHNNQHNNQINESNKVKKQDLQISFSILNKRRDKLKNKHLDNNEFNIVYKNIDTTRDNIDLRKNNSLSVRGGGGADLDCRNSLEAKNVQSLRSSILMENFNMEKGYFFDEKILNEQQNNQNGQMYEKVKGMMKEQRKQKQLKNNNTNTQQGTNVLDISCLNEYANIDLTQDNLNATYTQSSKTQQSSRFDIKSLTELDFKKIKIEKNEIDLNSQKIKQNTSENISEQDQYKIMQNGLQNNKINKNRKIESAKPNKSQSTLLQEQQVNSQVQLSDLISRIKEAGKQRVLASHKSSFQLEQSSLNNTISTFKNTNNEIDLNQHKKQQQVSQQQFQYTSQSTMPCSSFSSMSKIQSNRLQVNRQKVSSCGKIVVFDEYQLSEKDISSNQPKQNLKLKVNGQQQQQQSSSSTIRIGEFQYLSETDVLPPPNTDFDNLISPSFQPPLTSRNLKQRNRQFNFGPLSSRESKSISRFDDLSQTTQSKTNELNSYTQSNNNFHHHKSQSLKIQMNPKQETSIQISQISSDHSKQDNIQLTQNQSISSYSTSQQLSRSMTANQIELTSRPQLRNNLSRQSSNEQKSLLLKQTPTLTSRSNSQRDKEIESYIFWKNVQSVSIEKELNKENVFTKKPSNDIVHIQSDEDNVSPIFNQLQSFMNGRSLKKKLSIKEILAQRSQRNSMNQENSIKTVQTQSNITSPTQINNSNTNQTFSSQILQLNLNKLNSQQNNQNNVQVQINQNKTNQQTKGILQESTNNADTYKRDQQSKTKITSQMNKENTNTTTNKTINFENKYKEESLNMYQNYKQSQSHNEQNISQLRSNSSCIQNDHPSQEYYKNNNPLESNIADELRNHNTISRKQLFIKRHSSNPQNDVTKIGCESENINIKEYLKNQAQKQKQLANNNNQVEQQLQKQSSLESQSSQQNNLSHNIQSNMKVFSNMDRLKNGLKNRSNRQITIKEQEESHLITSSNFNYENLQKEENQIELLSSNYLNPYYQASKFKSNNNNNRNDLSNELSIQYKGKNEKSNKSSLFKLSDQTIDDLYSEKEDIGLCMDQLIHLNMSDNKLVDLSMEKDNKTHQSLLAIENYDLIANKEEELSIKQDENKYLPSNLEEKENENVQKIVVKTNANNFQNQEQQHNYQIEITLTQESQNKQEKQIDLQKIKLHMNEKKKKQNLVEQLQKNYNINSKEFLKKTILNNIQNKYNRDQNNQNQDNEERQNQLSNRDKLDVDYSINPSSYMDQSQDRLSKLRRQFSNTMEMSKKDIQENFSSSNINNSKKDSDQCEDNCSIINMMNSSFTNSMANSDNHNNQMNQNNNNPKKSKYFQESQNIQLRRVPSTISNVNNQESEEKQTLMLQSPENQQTTKQSNQSFNLEDDYKNYPAFFNTINKNPSTKKLNRLKSYADMNSAQREYPEKFMNINLQQQQQTQQSQEMQPIPENRNDRSSSCVQMNDYNTPQNKKKPFEITLRRSPSLMPSPDFSKKMSEYESFDNKRVSQFSQFYQKYQNQESQQQTRQSGENQLGKQNKQFKSYQSLLKPQLVFSTKYQNSFVFVSCSATLYDKLNQMVVQFVINDKNTLRYCINYSPLQLLEDIQSPHHSQSETIWPLVNEYMERDLLKKYGVQTKYDFNNLVKSQQFDLRITPQGNVLFTNNQEYQILNQNDKQGVIGIKSIIDSLFQDSKYIQTQQRLTGRVITLINSKEDVSSPNIQQLRKMNSLFKGSLKKQIYDSQEKKVKNKYVEEDKVKQNIMQTYLISFIIGKKSQKFYFLSLHLQSSSIQSCSSTKNISLSNSNEQMDFLVHLSNTKNTNSTQVVIPLKSFDSQSSQSMIGNIIEKIKSRKTLSITQKQFVRNYIFSQFEVSEDLSKLNLINPNTNKYLNYQNEFQMDNHLQQQHPLYLLKEETQEDFEDKELNMKFSLFNNKYKQLSKILNHEKNVLNFNGQIIQQDTHDISDQLQLSSQNQRTSIVELEEQFSLNDYVKQRRTGIRSRYHQSELVNINSYLRDKVMYLNFSNKNSIQLNYRIIFILRKQMNNDTNKIQTSVIMKKYSSYLNERLLIYKTNCKRAVQLFNMAYTTKSKASKMNLHSLVFRNQLNQTFFTANSFNRDLQFHYTQFYSSPVPFQALPSIPLLKTMLLKNSPILSKIFFHREIRFLERTERLGKIVVKMNVYQNYHDMFVCLSINEYQEKMKEYNIILSKSDIEMILNRQLKEDIKYIPKENLIDISRNLLQHMYFDQNFIYKLLKVNLEGKAYQNSFDQLQYYNSLKHQSKTRNTPHKINNQKFLQRDYKKTRTILHQVAIHNNDYTIITIERHLHFDAFLFNLYFPKSSRKIRAYLTLNELKELSQIDMRLILREITHRFSIVDQKKFCFQDYLQNCAKSLNSKLQYRPSFNLDCAINQQSTLQLSKLEYNVSKELKEFDKFSKERNRKVLNIFEISCHRVRNTREKFDRYKEFRIWEKILGLVQVVLRGEQYFIEIGTSVVIPTIEYLTSQIIRIDTSDDCYCAEYYLSSRTSNSSQNSAALSNNLPVISYSNSEDYDIFIRFYQFGQEKFIQKRLNSRSLLNLQVADGFFKNQANYSQSKILLCDLHQLTYFISYKIFNLDFPEIQSHLPLSKGNNQTSYSSHQIYKRNIMRRLVYLLVDEDKYHQNKSKALESNSFTQTLCSNPQTIATYTFCPGEKQVRITLYLPNCGLQYFSQIYFTELEQSIPLFSVQYNACTYQNLFRQISILYKQQLINTLNNIL